MSLLISFCYWPMNSSTGEAADLKHAAFKCNYTSGSLGGYLFIPFLQGIKLAGLQAQASFLLIWTQSQNKHIKITEWTPYAPKTCPAAVLQVFRDSNVCEQQRNISKYFVLLLRFMYCQDITVSWGFAVNWFWIMQLTLLIFHSHAISLVHFLKIPAWTDCMQDWLLLIF